MPWLSRVIRRFLRRMVGDMLKGMYCPMVLVFPTSHLINQIAINLFRSTRNLRVIISIQTEIRRLSSVMPVIITNTITNLARS